MMNVSTCLIEMRGPSFRDPPPSSLYPSRQSSTLQSTRDERARDKMAEADGARVRENTCRHFGVAVVVRYEDSQVLSNFKNLSRIILTEATGR